MRDGRQRHGHVLVFLVMNAMEGCRRFLRGLVHSVPEMPIGTSGVPEAPSGIVLAKCFGMCSIHTVIDCESRAREENIPTGLLYSTVKYVEVR